VLQGERDPFGTREDVRGYRLSTNIRVEWFEGGDHSLCPNARSGFTEQQHLSRALDLAAAFSKGV
jgi:predicted alpha/beta-hydrolase family hydrolase